MIRLTMVAAQYLVAFLVGWAMSLVINQLGGGVLFISVMGALVALVGLAGSVAIVADMLRSRRPAGTPARPLVQTGANGDKQERPGVQF